MAKITGPLHSVSLETDGVVSVLNEARPAELDERGVPYAAAVGKGFGVPIVAPGCYEVQLDGLRVRHCVAFDRRAGAVWHYAHGPGGRVIVDGGKLHVIKRHGVVTVQPLKGGR